MTAAALGADARRKKRETADQFLRDYNALRRPDTDPELEAIRVAIFLEETFDVTLSDSDIDAAVLTDPSALAALVTRLSGAV